ncbi:hypothetical protein BDW22DRAFT_1410298 [Trametopsis cervina]|nr:hypothetical protein BDW22DRAFT_1410298 [Trametopsis cervina]
MVTTRRQAENPEAKPVPRAKAVTKPRSKGGRKQKEEVKGKKEGEETVEVGIKRDSGGDAEAEEPPAKKSRVDAGEGRLDSEKEEKEKKAGHTYQSGTIERGHIYFFYRPRVELEEVHSLDDVQRFHMLLVPRPPEFAAGADSSTSEQPKLEENDEEMKVLKEGADAVPAAPATGVKKKPFRLVSIGKKSLPDPDAGGGGRGGGRKAVFWATVVTVGEDLAKLQEGLGGKEYETKTRGTRHQGPARIAARGAYAIVNSEGRTPSSRETHLGYYLSHPAADNFGEVQKALGIHQASSFVLQVKKPDAPNTGPANIGLSKGRRAEFSEEIMREVFGKGGARGRESYGLKFATVERREMLDYEGAELLFIAARSGEEGLENSLGEGRGEALAEAEKAEETHSVDSVLKELAIDAEKIPAAPLEGEWE